MVIPNLFIPHKVPKRIPESMRKFIKKHKKDGKFSFLKIAFLEAARQSRGARHNTFTQARRLYHSKIEQIWNSGKYLHCMQSVFLLRTLLIRSKLFTEDNIKQVFNTTFFIIPHVTLKVKVDDKEYRLDPWAYRFGIEFGDYMHGFHKGKVKEFR